MLLIVGALTEELKLAVDLCKDAAFCDMHGLRFWRGTSPAAAAVAMLRVGIGPKRSAGRLRRALACLQPARVLCIGYCGALDPSLHVGDLVIAGSASLLAFGEHPTLQELVVERRWELSFCDELLRHAAAAGLRASSGGLVTSSRVVGDPAQKRHLHQRFEACAVDMETAALAGAAAAAGVPFGCIRAVSDSATDSFLSPLGFQEAGSTAIGRAAGFVRSGNWAHRLREWRDRSAAARDSLMRFLSSYLG
jgi:adenosylhomocysteine nucleosidase